MLIVFSSFNTYPRDNNFLEDVANIACGVGAMALGVAGVAGAVKLATWCFSETNEQLLARAQSEYNQVITKYKKEVLYFESLVHEMQPEYVSEDIVYALGENIWHMGVDEHLYRSQLRSWCKTVSTTIKSLRDRAIDIAHSDYPDYRMSNRMNLQADTMEKFVFCLRQYSDVLNEHASFYALSWQEGKLQQYYASELDLLNAGYSQAKLGYKLKDCVIAHNRWATYPYSAFIERLESDIASLHRLLNRLVYHYPSRIAYVHHLIESLDYIRFVIVADSAYSREVFAKQQAELEKIRRSAARERAEAEWARMEAKRAHFDARYERQKLLHEKGKQECDVTFTIKL